MRACAQNMAHYPIIGKASHKRPMHEQGFKAGACFWMPCCHAYRTCNDAELGHHNHDRPAAQGLLRQPCQIVPSCPMSDAAYLHQQQVISRAVSCLKCNKACRPAHMLLHALRRIQYLHGAEAAAHWHSCSALDGANCAAVGGAGQLA